MAGNSFVDGRLPSRHVNLNNVNRILKWNPHPRARDSCWDEIPESNLQYRNTNALESAKRFAENSARQLLASHDGRLLLDAEDAGEYAEDPKFWFARGAYYSVEYDKLDQEERKWRDPTPEVYYPSPWETELDRAKGSTQNAAQLLARFPTGKALLEAEDHEGSPATDPEYWWSKEKLYKTCYEAEYQKTELERAKRRSDDVARDLATFPAGKVLLDAEDHRDSAIDPEYWRSRERLYKAEKERLTQEFWDHWKRVHLEGSGSPAEAPKPLQSEKHCAAECRKAELDRAKRCADNAARYLAQFAAGKALLEAEDHGDAATDPAYWWSREKLYAAERWKLEQEFWEHWKRTHLDGGVVACESPNNSKRKTRARQSAVTKESRTIRSTRSIARRRKASDRVHSEATPGYPTSYADSGKSMDVHSTGRRMSKNEYRRQKASAVSRKPASSHPGCSAIQKPVYSYVTPKSDDSGTPAAAITERHKASARKTRHKVMDLDTNGRLRQSRPQSHNPYVTPSSQDLAKAKARQRHKRKGAARQKLRRAADSAYRGLKPGPQPIEPISSRLRSSMYHRENGVP